MAKTIKISLGGQDYEVPRLNIGQVEDLAEFGERTGPLGEPLDANGEPLKGKPLVSYTLEVAAIVLRRAAPAIGSIRDLECSLADIQEAVTSVMVFNQLVKDAPSGNGGAGTSPAA